MSSEETEKFFDSVKEILELSVELRVISEYLNEINDHRSVAKRISNGGDKLMRIGEELKNQYLARLDREIETLNDLSNSLGHKDGS